MQSHLSNPWNSAVCFLETLFRAQKLGNGTCFFWERAGRTYLVTNWHNLSGRNPLTCKPMSSRAAIPDRIRFMTYRRDSEPDAHGHYKIAYVPVEVPICNEDFSEPRWFEHPSLGRRVDVAALDVTDAIGDLDVRHANRLECDAVLDPITAQDVFVIGFPFGLISGAPAAVWKRGSVAIDPTFDIDGLPKMLIDTASREGMSGSVVVARHIVVGREIPRKDGTLSERVLYAQADVVVGVYSGRHFPDLEKAQLGIVWKRIAIEDVVQGRKLPAAT